MTKSPLYRIPVVDLAQEVAIHSLSHFDTRDVDFLPSRQVIEVYTQASMASAIATHGLVAHTIVFSSQDAGWPSTLRGWGNMNVEEHLKNTAGLALLALNELRSLK